MSRESLGLNSRPFRYDAIHPAANEIDINRCVLFIYDAEHYLNPDYGNSNIAIFSHKWQYSGTWHVVFLAASLLYVGLCFNDTYAFTINEGLCTLVLEIVCLLIFSIDTYLSYQSYGNKTTLWYAAFIGIGAIDCALRQYHIQSYMAVLRVVFLLVSADSVLYTLTSIFRSIPPVLVLLMLQFISVYFFACVTVVLFGKLDPNFQNFWNATMSMYSLSKLANNPKVWLPLYLQNKYYITLFLIFIVISVIFLPNLILTVVYNKYVEAMQMSIREREVFRLRSLLKAFRALDIRRSNHLQPEVVQRVLSHMRPQYGPDKILILYSCIDASLPSKEIDFEQFCRITKALNIRVCLWTGRKKRDVYGSGHGEEGTESEYDEDEDEERAIDPTSEGFDGALSEEDRDKFDRNEGVGSDGRVLALVGRRHLLSNSPNRTVRVISNARKTMCIIHSFTNVLFVGFICQETELFWDNTYFTNVIIVITLLTAFSTLGVIATIRGVGIKRFLKNYWDCMNLVACFFSVTGVLLAICMRYSPRYTYEVSDDKIRLCLVMALLGKCMDMLQVVRLVPPFKIIISSIAVIVPGLWPYLAALYSIIHVFAYWGMFAFGGTNPQAVHDPLLPLTVLNNFDSMQQTLLTLFIYFVNNGWDDASKVNANNTMQVMRLYFILFNIITSMFCLSSISAYFVMASSSVVARREAMQYHPKQRLPKQLLHSLAAKRAEGQLQKHDSYTLRNVVRGAVASIAQIASAETKDNRSELTPLKTPDASAGCHIPDEEEGETPTPGESQDTQLSYSLSYRHFDDSYLLKAASRIEEQDVKDLLGALSSLIRVSLLVKKGHHVVFCSSAVNSLCEAHHPAGRGAVIADVDHDLTLRIRRRKMHQHIPTAASFVGDPEPSTGCDGGGGDGGSSGVGVDASESSSSFHLGISMHSTGLVTNNKKIAGHRGKVSCRRVYRHEDKSRSLLEVLCVSLADDNEEPFNSDLSSVFTPSRLTIYTFRDLQAPPKV
jgi:hypothetical protein